MAISGIFGNADYLGNEVSAAWQAGPDVEFTGTWGRGRATNDVTEGIGWLMQAVQQKSKEEGNAVQALPK